MPPAGGTARAKAPRHPHEASQAGGRAAGTHGAPCNHPRASTHHEKHRTHPGLGPLPRLLFLPGSFLGRPPLGLLARAGAALSRPQALSP